MEKLVDDETMMVEHLNCICDLECHIFGGGKVPKKRLPIIKEKVLVEEIVEFKEHPQDIVKWVHQGFDMPMQSKILSHFVKVKIFLFPNGHDCYDTWGVGIPWRLGEGCMAM